MNGGPEFRFGPPFLLLYLRRESNPNRRNRNPIFYPLNYGDIFVYAKLIKFAILSNIHVVFYRRTPLFAHFLLTLSSCLMI